MNNNNSEFVPFEIMQNLEAAFDFTRIAIRNLAIRGRNLERIEETANELALQSGEMKQNSTHLKEKPSCFSGLCLMFGLVIAVLCLFMFVGAKDE